MVGLPQKGSWRTCIGCRKSESVDGLLRLTASGNPLNVEPDLERTMPGRGASIHPRRSCFNEAARRSAFKRAWNGEPTVSIDDLVARVLRAYYHYIEKLLLTAKRNCAAVCSFDAVREVTLQGKTELLLIAQDCLEDIGVKRERQLGSRLLVFGTKDSFGRLFGSGTSVVALVDRLIAQKLTRAAEGLVALAEGA